VDTPWSQQRSQAHAGHLEPGSSARTPWSQQCSQAHAGHLGRGGSARTPWAQQCSQAHAGHLEPGSSARTPWSQQCSQAHAGHLGRGGSARTPWSQQRSPACVGHRHASYVPSPAESTTVAVAGLVAGCANACEEFARINKTACSVPRSALCYLGSIIKSSQHDSE
jgi:hypothetical protein